jgi:hypothetical protein
MHKNKIKNYNLLLSGMIYISGNGGGSEEKKTLKFLCVLGLLKIYSMKPSNPFNP